MVPGAAAKAPVVPVPAVTVAPVPVVVELVVEFTTVPVALPVRIWVVNWLVLAIRAAPSALVTWRVGGVLVSVQEMAAAATGVMTYEPEKTALVGRPVCTPLASVQVILVE